MPPNDKTGHRSSESLLPQAVSLSDDHRHIQSASNAPLKSPLLGPSAAGDDAAGDDDGWYVDMVRPATTDGLVRNFILMSIAFGLNHGCVTSLISLSSVELGDLGTYANGTLYVVYTFTAAVLSHAVTARFGHKRTLVFGVTLYCLYVLSYLVAAAVPDLKGPAVIIGGALGGFAAGFLWPAQGSYFSTTAKLYALDGGAESIEAANAKFSSMFAGIYLGTEVLLKVVSSLVLSNEDKWKGGKTLVYVVLAITAVSTAVGMNFISKLAPRRQSSDSRGPIPVGKLALSAFSLLVKDPKCALMIPMNFTFGFASAYLNSYIGPNVIAADGGIGGEYVPYLAAIMVGAATLVSYGFGRVGKTAVGKVASAMLGALAFGTFVFVFVLQPVDQQIALYGSSWAALVPLYMLYGLGRSAWEGPFKGTFADYFPDDKEAAFANVQLQSGLASTIGFFCTPKLLAMEDTAVPGSVMLAGIAVLFALLALLAQPLSFAFYRLENRLRKAERKADSGLLV